MLLFILFTHLLLVFLVLIFDVRKPNGAFVSCAYIPCTMKFNAIIYKSVEKNKPVPSKHGGYKILPWIVREGLFE